MKGTWENARAFCLRDGGVLATIDSEEINNELVGWSGGFEAWIGLNKRNTQDWVWDEGNQDALPVKSCSRPQTLAQQPLIAAQRLQKMG